MRSFQMLTHHDGDKARLGQVDLPQRTTSLNYSPSPRTRLESFSLSLWSARLRQKQDLRDGTNAGPRHDDAGIRGEQLGQLGRTEENFNILTHSIMSLWQFRYKRTVLKSKARCEKILYDNWLVYFGHCKFLAGNQLN